jgi:hypothetical protein
MNKHCYVIGGGPSLIGFDFNALPKGTRIGANCVAWLVNCDILLSVDNNFHNKERARIAAFPGEKHFGISVRHERIPGATYWHHAPALDGLAFSNMTLAGSNSGFAALNLAVQLGYTDIALLGLDMKWDGDRTHFHEGYGQKREIERRMIGWAQAFDVAAVQLRDRGISVTNFVGPMGSRVKAFPTAPLRDLI